MSDWLAGINWCEKSLICTIIGFRVVPNVQHFVILNTAEIAVWNMKWEKKHKGVSGDVPFQATHLILSLERIDFRVITAALPRLLKILLQRG